MVDWAKRIGRRLKLHDLHILLDGRAVWEHGESRPPALPFPIPWCRRQSRTLSMRWGYACSFAAGKASRRRSMAAHCWIAALIVV